MRETSKQELTAIVGHLSGMVGSYRTDASAGVSVTLVRLADDHEHTVNCIQRVLDAEAAADAADEAKAGFKVTSRDRRIDGSIMISVVYNLTGRIDSRTFTREQLDAMPEAARANIEGGEAQFDTAPLPPDQPNVQS